MQIFENLYLMVLVWWLKDILILLEGPIFYHLILFLKDKFVGGQGEGKEMKKELRYAYVPTPPKECKHCLLQACTNKILTIKSLKHWEATEGL